MRTTAVVLTVRNGLVLAVSRPSPPPRFGLPGGGVDDGETLRCAARRELLEETGMLALVLLPLLEARRPGQRVVTYWAPTVAGELRSSHEGIAAWVRPNLVLEGPYGEHAERAFAALSNRCRVGVGGRVRGSAIGPRRTR